MTRAIFEKGQLNQFISRCKSQSNLSLPQLAQAILVERHTLNDWRRGERLPNLEKLKELSELTHIPLPAILETKSDTWGSAKAGLIRQQKYGCTLSIEDRINGGHASQAARKANPEYYAKLGCPIPRDFVFPDHNDCQLAEFIGILLGDGCIQPEQVSITLNSDADRNYIIYVSNLVTDLFQYSPSIHPRFPTKATVLLISGKDFTAKLVSRGMKIGDKVRQQVDVPNWIKLNPEYSRWCLRGLMDTDGGIFTNSYVINGKSYVYPKTNFTNASQPLLDFVYNTLKSNGFHPNNRQPRKVWLYSQVESRRYLEVIGSSNERLLKKIR